MGRNTWRSRVEPGERIVWTTVIFCHAVVRVKFPTLDFTTVEPFISLMLILIKAPAWSPRTQMLDVYVPAVVVVTQFG